MKKIGLILLAVLLGCAAMANDNVLPKWALGGFTRPEGVNPLVSPTSATTFQCPMKGAAVKWECADTFNPAAVEKDGKVVVMYRAEDDPTAGIGKRTSRIGYVELADGVHVDYRSTTPVMYPDKSTNSKTYEWTGGTEDPRVVEATVNGKTLYVMAYTAWNRSTARLSIATSSDLKTWTHQGPAFLAAYDGKFQNLACKSGSIVTEVKDGRLQAAKVTVNGAEKYLMYWGEYWVCAATSDDLINWTPIVDDDGNLLYLAKPRTGYFDSQLTECGPPAVKTENGIVLLYNGKNKSGTSGDPCYAANTYAAGQMLFSLDNPLQLKDRLDKPFFRPMEDFEKSGQYVAGTVFVEGLVLHQGKWYLYYGCADSFVGVAVYDPATSVREGDPVLATEVPEGVINQQRGLSTGKMRCFINSCSGQAATTEGPGNMLTSYIYPSLKWCDTNDTPWIVFEFTDLYMVDRLTFKDVANREDNCGNVPEYWVYVRETTREDWKLVAHADSVDSLDEKDIRFPAVQARYVKLMVRKGTRPSGTADSAIRLYGVDIYGEYAGPITRTDGQIGVGKTVLLAHDTPDAASSAMNLLTGAASADRAWKPTTGVLDTDPLRYVVIDLEDWYDIKRFQLWDAKSEDADATNMNAFQLYVSQEEPDLSLIGKTDDENTCWTLIADKKNVGATNKKLVSLASPVTARYVKLLFPRTSATMNNATAPALYALYIYGTTSETGVQKVVQATPFVDESVYDLQGRKYPVGEKPQGMYIKGGRAYRR